MNTRKVAEEYRLAHWAQILKERHESGLSNRAFCEQTGIKEKTYYYWQRKLRETICLELLTGSQNDPLGADESTLSIEINGCRVFANADTDPEMLAKTCRVLMSLC